VARRHTSGFDILGFDSDPTPGDPDVILNQIIPTYTSLGDDAQSAFDALRGNAMADGTGKTMDALRKVIGSKYPPKLQQTADSFHGAAQVYRTYAQSLSDAQSQLDNAMDQAQQVAGTANLAVTPPPADATPEQLSAAKTQQQNVDQANADLTAAKRLGQDAKDLRDQAGHTFNKNLGAVSTVPERSFFQKFLDFFEHNPLIKILIDVAIAITTVFFPVVGLALGAAAFLGTTVLDTISTGHFDVGSFVTGLAGLAVGGLGVAAKFFPSIVKGAESLNSGLRAIPGVGKFFRNDPKLLKTGLGNQIKKFGTDFGKSAGLEFGKGVVGGFASTGINDAIDGKQFTGVQAIEVVAGAGVGAVLGGGLGAADKQIFPKPHFIKGDGAKITPPDTPPAHVPATGGGDGGLKPPTADARPDSVADPGSVAAGDGPPAITVTPAGSTPPPAAPVSSGGLQPGSHDIRSDGKADSGAFGKVPPNRPLPKPSDSSAGGDTPPDEVPQLVIPNHEGTIGRQGFDAAKQTIKGLGGSAADVGIAEGLGDEDKTDNGDVPSAIADGATDSLPDIASGAAGGELHRIARHGGVGGPK
jgi:hypothetical protein